MKNFFNNIDILNCCSIVFVLVLFLTFQQFIIIKYFNHSCLFFHYSSEISKKVKYLKVHLLSHTIEDKSGTARSWVQRNFFHRSKWAHIVTTAFKVHCITFHDSSILILFIIHISSGARIVKFSAKNGRWGTAVPPSVSPCTDNRVGCRPAFYPLLLRAFPLLPYLALTKIYIHTNIRTHMHDKLVEFCIFANVRHRAHT